MTAMPATVPAVALFRFFLGMGASEGQLHHCRKNARHGLLAMAEPSRPRGRRLPLASVSLVWPTTTRDRGYPLASRRSERKSLALAPAQGSELGTSRRRLRRRHALQPRRWSRLPRLRLGERSKWICWVKMTAWRCRAPLGKRCSRQRRIVRDD
jgi:hypothetical protein